MKIYIKNLLITITIIIGFTSLTFAQNVPITVPSAPGSGYMLLSNSTGRYNYIFATSTGAGFWTQIGASNDIFNTLLGNVLIGDVSGGTFTPGGSENLFVGQLMSAGQLTLNNTGNGTFANADNSGQIVNNGTGSLIVGNSTDSGLLQTGATSAFSLGYVSGSGSTVQANGDGTISNGATFNSGAIYSSGSGSVASGYSTDSGSQISSSNDGSYAIGGTFNGGQINSTGIGTIAAGYSTDPRSTINSLSDGSLATGGVSNGGILTASANSSGVIGYADGYPSMIEGLGVGSFSHGNATNGGLINAGSEGSISGGVSDGESTQILANSEGSFAHGYADSAGAIEANGTYASFAFGKSSDSTIQANDDGAMVTGSASNGSTITAAGGGSFSHGLAQNGATINTTDPGGEAFGWVSGGGSGQGYITANGFGAFTGGSVDSTFGTNSQINSNGTALAWGFVNSGAQGIFANSNGAIAMGSSIDTGSILQSNSFGSFAEGAAFGGSNIAADGAGSHAGGRATNGSTIRAEGTGSFAHGQTDGSGSILSAEGSGDFDHGVVFDGSEIRTYSLGAFSGGYTSGGTSQIDTGLHNSAQGGLAHGKALGSGSAIYSDGNGATALGYANNAGVIQADADASLVNGYTNAGTIETTSVGAFAGGVAGNDSTSGGLIKSDSGPNFLYGEAIGNDGGSNTSTLYANGTADLVVGQAYAGGIIRTGDNGSWAGGYAYQTDGAGTPSEIHASRTSLAFGNAQNGGTIEAISGFTGTNFALGLAESGETVTAEGTAAVAIGENVIANGTNIFTLGKDFTNASSSSFEVGFGGERLYVEGNGVQTFDGSNILSIDGINRGLSNSAGQIRYDWENGLINAGAINAPRFDIANGVLKALTGLGSENSINIQSRNIYYGGGTDVAYDYGNGLIKYPGAYGNGTFLNISSGAAYDKSGNLSDNFDSRIWLNSAGTTMATYSGSSVVIPLASTTMITASIASSTTIYDSELATPAGTFITADPQGRLIASTTPAALVTSVFGRTGAIVSATNDYSEAQISFSDITTNNVSTSKHGYVPKAPNSGSGFFLSETGNWSDSSTDLAANNITAGHDLTASNQLKVGSYLSRYQNLTTNGIGMPVNYCENNKSATTTAGNICTLNTNAFVAGFGTFWVSCYLNINTISADVLQAQISYTDENNTSQTIVVPLMPTGFTGSLLASASAIGNNSCISQTIRVKQNTNIVGKIVFTTGIGSVNYDSGFSIHEVSGGFNPN